MKYLFLSFLVSVMAFCTKPVSNVDNQKPLDLINTNWQLVKFQPIGGKLQAALNDEAILVFSDAKSVGGNSGCNVMGGDYTIEGNQLTIQAFGTKMYCEEVAAQENAINEIMSGVMTVSMKDGQLVLSRDGGKLIYRKQDEKTALVPDADNGSAPAQYDRNPAEAGNEKAIPVTASQPDQATTASPAKTIEMTGLFRYMADAAVFQRCSDGSRYAVSMAGDFKTAESYYNRMEKYGAPALMSFDVEVDKNPGEGLAEILTIRKVNSSSYDDNCPE